MDNQDKGKSIVIIVLLIIVFILMGLLYVKVFLNKVDDNKNQLHNTNQTINDIEKELTDVYIKKDISKKASIMLTFGNSKSEEDAVKEGWVDVYKLTDLTEKDKLAIILRNNKDKSQILSSSDVNQYVPTIYKNSKSTLEVFTDEHDGFSKIIDGNIISKNYQEMFNSNSTNYDLQFDYGCPGLFYDNQTNYYAFNNSCGGLYPDIYFNKYKYTIKGNNIYVYAAIAIVDIDNKKVYKDIKEEDSNFLYTYETDEKVLNDIKTNPQKYSQYKLTFEKNTDGTYYYKTTEKISA